MVNLRVPKLPVELVNFGGTLPRLEVTPDVCESDSIKGDRQDDGLMAEVVEGESMVEWWRLQQTVTEEM